MHQLWAVNDTHRSYLFTLNLLIMVHKRKYQAAAKNGQSADNKKYW
ncbi:hypothetical protein CLV51_103306 [Chitinophaga niastensis]|uniref:Uncharacterized protein n=1 Tax=Chitinophaga niastensis TaxID=536980 RepID=A0A2P8HJD2_CHINA|nr:hypothetical protein CLV51_103306 [Chitinophaga niastensis]